MVQYKINIGVELGTSKLRLYKDGKQVLEVLTEYHQGKKVFDNLMKQGKIADFYAVEQLIRQELSKVNKRILGIISPPFTSLVSVSSDMNETAMMTFRRVMENAGSRHTFMLNDCFIAAIGLGIDLENSVSMIIDSGAGKTSITTIRGYKILNNDIIDIAGRDFDTTIQAYIRSQYGLVPELKDVEKLKMKYVDFRKYGVLDKPVKITGVMKNTETKAEITVQAREITDCLADDVDFFIRKVVRHFQNLDDNVQEKIKQSGVCLIGGNFKLKGFIELISESIIVSPKSYLLNRDYMKEGFEKIQSNRKLLPQQLYFD